MRHTMAITALIPIIGSVLNKIIPDPAQKAEATAKLIELQQSGELKEMDAQMQMIVAEAQSQDPWTSRARPTFLYVMYIMILGAIPLGILAAFNAEMAVRISEGITAWLHAIPAEMWALFGAGYLGYVKKRSDDKQVAAGQEPKKFLGLF